MASNRKQSNSKNPTGEQQKNMLTHTHSAKQRHTLQGTGKDIAKHVPNCLM